MTKLDEPAQQGMTLLGSTKYWPREAQAGTRSQPADGKIRTDYLQVADGCRRQTDVPGKR